ncbi:MAG: hypothetical protein HS115_19275 [Spirochaetales bacterium]|nr:hypothetical protein [Spirochaetales bacterium]
MQDKELNTLFLEFLGAFEVVFHYDWDYTKIMIGDESPKHTIIRTGLEDETEDWGTRGQLLESYRNLKRALKERNLHAPISEIWHAHLQNALSGKETLEYAGTILR